MDEGPVVSNTTPLINLAGVGHLDLLHALFGEVWIPEAVGDEYDAGARPADQRLDQLPWLLVKPVAIDAPLLNELDAGEAAAISLAVASGARVLLLDERMGRRVAISRGLPIVGTLAVLLKAKREGHLQAVRPVLDEMTAQGRYFSRSLRESVLRAAGEHPVAE